MGIRNLNKFLQKHVPQAFVERHLEEYRDKLVAIDTMMYLYKFKSNSRNRWVSAFIGFLATLKKYGIRPVFIYDTKPSELKEPLLLERRQKRAQVEQRVALIKSDLENYILSGVETETLMQIMDKSISRGTKLLMQTVENISKIDKTVIEAEIIRLERQIIYISKRDIDITKELLSYLGIAYFDSPSEAETLASHMCCLNLVDAVLSNDSDVLVYGTPHFITNLAKDCVTSIDNDKLLELIDLTLAQFIDFCIMCGTDYNPNIFRIGPEKSYKLIKKYDSIDNIGKETDIDISILNHIQVRELFKVPEKLFEYNLEKSPHKLPELKEFLVRHHCPLDLIDSLI